MTKILLLFMLALPLAASAGGRAAADTLELMFRVCQADVDLTFADNNIRLEQFLDRLGRLEPSRRGDYYIRVVTGASPEGPAEQNRQLGQQRGQALRQLLTKRMQQDGLDIWCGRIVVTNEGARWGRLYHDISQSNEPWKHRVMAILRQPAKASGNSQLDQREVLLRQLDGGSVWQQLQERYLPQLRSAGTAVLVPVVEPLAARRDTLVIRDTVYYMPAGYADGTPITQIAHSTHSAHQPHQSAPLRQGRALMLKSNLLLIATGTPNIGAEWWLGGRWSLQVEGVWSWWTVQHGAYANQVIYGGMEVRHWLGTRSRHSTLDGWYLGLGGGGGLYDLEWRSRGYQGEAVLGYLSVGWQKRFGGRRQWSVDIGIGGGLLFTQYKEYRGSSIYPDGHEEPHDDHLMWQKSGHLAWPGLTHANISIGYCFGK